MITTNRLRLRKLEIDDASFILMLVNEPGWLAFIGDRNIHTIAEAKNYIVNGPQSMYRQYGFGLLLVQDRYKDESFGLCGLLQRDHLDAPDLGFALLGSAEGKGYAYEASHAVLTQEFGVNHREKIWAFTKPDNVRSQKLLLKLDFKKWGNKMGAKSQDAMFLNEGNSFR